MGIGSYIFGPYHIVQSNAIVDVESYTTTRDRVGGGTIPTYTTTASSVDVLISLIKGDRAGAFMSDEDSGEMTVSGVEPLLNNDHARYKITAYPTRPEMVGYYLRVKSVQGHPKSQNAFVPPIIRANCIRVGLPEVVS